MMSSDPDVIPDDLLKRMASEFGEDEIRRNNRHAWDHALMSAKVVQYLDEYHRSGAVERHFPEILGIVGFGGGSSGHKDLWLHTRQVVDQCDYDAGVLVRWAALFHDVGKPNMIRIQKGEVTFHGHEFLSYKFFKAAAVRTGWFNKEESDRIEFLVRYLGNVEEYDSSWTDSAVRRLINLNPAYFNDLVTLASADITTKHEHKRRAHAVRMQELKDRAKVIIEQDSRVPALVTGLGVELSKALGIPPSKALGDLMKELTQAVEEGKLERQAPPETVIAFVKSRAG